MLVHKVDFIPLKVLWFYIVLGVSLSFWGPIMYEGYDKLSVYAYMLSFLMLFSLGYILAFINNDSQADWVDSTYQNFKQQKVMFWVKISIVSIFLVQLVTLLLGVVGGELNLSISKMGKAYVDMYTDYERGTGNISIVFLVQIFTYIPYLVSLILGAYYFKELPRKYKIMVIFIYLSIVLIETIGHGKQKQLGDLFIFLSIALFLKVDLLNKKMRKKLFKTLYVFAVVCISALVSILYFRYSAIGINVENINEKTNPLMEYDLDHTIFHVFGDEIGFPLTVFTGYLSQGYYGLSLSLQQSFEWTYMVGNSYSLSILLQRYFGVPVDFHSTYSYRASVATGWDDSKWSTVFVWYAGDITFLGTLILFALIAFLYAKVWREAYRYKNPISIILFSMLTIALLYIPANNQIMHTPGSIIAIFFFIILWIFKHKKFNFYKIDT